MTLLTPGLVAVPKNVPNTPNTPATGVCPTPPPGPSSEIVKGVAGAASTVCALAVTSGSFIIGATCSVLVVYGILKAQGK